MRDRQDTEPLLERESELREISGLLEDAFAGRGRFLLVEGPPGIGKTRLLEAARSAADRRGMISLSARASELDRQFPFGVIRQLFEPLVATDDFPRRRPLLEGLASPAAPLLGRPGPAGTASPEPAETLAHFQALYWVVVNAVEEAPAAVVIDDAHWSDLSSLHFLQFVLPRIEELPVLVILGARPREPGVDKGPIDALATDPLSRVMRPAPLSAAAVRTMVSRELGGATQSALSAACHKATGGNPFLVRELLRELASYGDTNPADLLRLVREISPPTVARAVLVRLGRLGDEAVAFAGALAISGDGAPIDLVSKLAGLSSERGVGLAAALAEVGILKEESLPAFAHPILRSAVYHDLAAPERSLAHRRAASLLVEAGAESDAVAGQLLATEPSGDPWVVAMLREAADYALARGAPPSAVAYLRRALREPPAPEERGALALSLASTELKAGEPGAAVEHFEDGLRLTPDPRTRAVQAGEHALALQAVGRDDDAFAVRERAAHDVADLDPPLALSIEATLIGTARWDERRHRWARTRLNRYADLQSPGRPAEWRLLVFRAHLDAFSCDSTQPASALADTAEPALEQLAAHDLDRGYASTGFFGAIEVLMLADRTDPVRRTLDRAVDVMRRRGSAPGFAFASAWRCLLRTREGALVDAEADADEYVDLALTQGWFGVAPMTLGFALDVLIERGEADRAERLLEGSGLADRPVDHRLAFDPVAHARARLRAVQGDLRAARADVEALQGRRTRWNTFPAYVPPVLVAPEVSSGGRDESRTSAERMLRQAEEWGTARGLGVALRAKGLIEGGERGIDLLREAVHVLETSPARLEHARALTDLGAALRRSNRRIAAREHLRQALDAAEDCGARLLSARARSELRAAGGRARRTRASGPQALTPSERRVAVMAAEGRSNTEIAQALFVTRKTVEAHLGSVYRKLGIESRVRLPSALAEG